VELAAARGGEGGEGGEDIEREKGHHFVGGRLQVMSLRERTAVVTESQTHGSPVGFDVKGFAIRVQGFEIKAWGS
jgi:hypothetical protein